MADPENVLLCVETDLVRRGFPPLRGGDDTPTPDVTPEVTPEVTPPEYVPKAEFDRLVTEMGSLKGAFTEQGTRLALLDKVAAVLTGKEESTLTKDEQTVVSELKRLMPHVLPNAKFLDQAPQLLKTVEAAQKGAGDALVQAAFGYQLELQGEAGMAVNDDKANFYIGTAIKEWINQDNSRRARFWRGDRTVVKEGFDEVKGVLSATRMTTKRTTMETVNSRPKNAGPGAGRAGTSGDVAPTVDFTDRKAVRDAFKAALAG